MTFGDNGLLSRRLVAKYVGDTYHGPNTDEERPSMIKRIRAAWQLVREADQRYAAGKRLQSAYEQVSNQKFFNVASPEAPMEDTVKHKVLITPTANGFIVQSYEAGLDPANSIVVESYGRQSDEVSRLLGQAVVKISSDTLMAAAPAAPAPAPQPASMSPAQ